MNKLCRWMAGLIAGLTLSLAAIAADKVPPWMVSPPADDGQWWYGTGEGPDLEAARRNGLRNVAAKLRSTIAGQVSNTTSVQSTNGKERVSIEAQNRVVETVAQTEFTKFEVAQSSKGGQGVYALVKVDRPAFISDTRNLLQVADKPVREAASQLPAQSTLDQFLGLRRLKKQIELPAALAARDRGRRSLQRRQVEPHQRAGRADRPGAHVADAGPDPAGQLVLDR